MITDELKILSPVSRQLPQAERVQVFAPHPDDEIFGCGGTLRLMRQEGSEISIVIVTDGARGDRESNPDLPEIRAEESRSAARLLDFCEPVFLQLPDRSLSLDDGLTDLLLRQLRNTAPDLVFLPAPTEIHPDHQVVAHAASQALQRYGKARAVYYEVGSPLPHLNLLVDISTVEDKKQEAMDCFISQLKTQAYDQQILGLNRFRAYSLGSQATSAEAFLFASLDEVGEGLPPLFHWPLMHRTEKVNRAQCEIKITELEKVIAQWEKWIAGLEQGVAERDGEINSLLAKVSERDHKLSDFEKVIAEWEKWLAGLEQAVLERDHEISALLTKVSERDGRIADLEKVIAEWENWISGLQQEISESNSRLAEAQSRITSLEDQITAMHNSTSWKVTAPLRTIMQKINKG